MLVLGTRVREKVFLTFGDIKITVTLVDILGPDKARIGFEAPQEVAILREKAISTMKKEMKDVR
jgi:carbon storage regulator CsrA